ncbi:MAG: barstar family protein [Thermodesulfobacteriota bacterium]
MPVKRSLRKFRLSGKAIGNLQEFYDEIARKLPFPEYFGRNLDALWDVLTTDVKGPVELIWEDSAASQKSMGKAFDKISALLREVEKEREDFKVHLR